MTGKHDHHTHAAEHGHGDPAGSTPDPQSGGEAGVDQEQPQSGSPEAEMAARDKEIAELKDKYLRALADSENVRKRMRQQGDDSLRIQREGLLRDLLPIVDNLERAVEAARGSGSGGSIVEGVEMVLRSLMDFMRSHGVTPSESMGQPFDPNRHEAVDHIESAAHEPNTVINEFHRGYQMGDRVLRPARVAVAKAPKDRNGDE